MEQKKIMEFIYGTPEQWLQEHKLKTKGICDEIYYCFKGICNEPTIYIDVNNNISITKKILDESDHIPCYIHSILNIDSNTSYYELFDDSFIFDYYGLRVSINIGRYGIIVLNDENYHFKYFLRN
jgi:hypothetical protein